MKRFVSHLGFENTPVLSSPIQHADQYPFGKSKIIETTQAELQEDNNPRLPPLMNPAMLEASEDLTNLSHLNEPAGLFVPSRMQNTTT